MKKNVFLSIWPRIDDEGLRNARVDASFAGILLISSFAGASRRRPLLLFEMFPHPAERELSPCVRDSQTKPESRGFAWLESIQMRRIQIENEESHTFWNAPDRQPL